MQVFTEPLAICYYFVMGKKRARPMTQSRLKSLVYYSEKTGKFYSRDDKRLLGTVGGKGYLMVQLGVKHYMLHQLAWLYMYGKFADGVVDHIDHNTLNNAKENLRDVSQLENCRNQKLSKKNTSGVTGVFWNKNKNKWTAGIRVNKKYISLGNYELLEEAILERLEANLKYDFHENHGKPLVNN